MAGTAKVISFKTTFIITDMPMMVMVITPGLGFVRALGKKGADRAGDAHDQLRFIVVHVLALSQVPCAIRSEPPEFLNGDIKGLGQVEL